MKVEVNSSPTTDSLCYACALNFGLRIAIPVWKRLYLENKGKCQSGIRKEHLHLLVCRFWVLFHM